MNGNKTDLISNFRPYLKNWKWLLFGAFLGLVVAVLYLRYTVPKYSAQASIQILEDKNGAAELSVLDDLDFLSGGKSKIEDEVKILGSRSNFIELVKRLNLNTHFFLLGNIQNTEIYLEKDRPFSINHLAADSLVNVSSAQLFIEIISQDKFRFKIDEEDDLFKEHEFGEKLSSSAGDLILIPNQNLEKYIGKNIFISILPVNYSAYAIRSNVAISAVDEKSNIINLYTEDPIRQRGVDILNNLIRINNQNTVSDKKAIADRTSKFINDRIADIYSSLSDVDETAENFKTSRGIADLGSQSNINFSQSAAGQQELQNADIQLNIAQSMQDLIANKEDYTFIPSNVGISDPGISNSAQRYNEIIAERNRLLESSNEKNPVIVKLNQQLDGLRKGMQSSLNNLTNNLNLKVNSLSQSLSQINSKIYSAPKNERALRDISRKQQTTESLYLYLLQKREESQITFASASPKSKIIDSGYGSISPVSPNNVKVFLAMLVLGFLVPFGVIYVRELLDNKVHSKIALEQLLGHKYSVIAELPRLKKKDNKLIQLNDRSILAESLRILRTNLDYLLQRIKHSKGKVILVTSSIPGEGKTFVSSNLSAILSKGNKRVLLVGADIRNPRLYNFYDELKNKGDKKGNRRNDLLGLTEFLLDDNINFDSLINKFEIGKTNLDMIYSGKIMPNPTELLMSKKLETFFNTARERYDYIIVDSAPLLVAADTLEISKYADKLIYITKAGVTEKKVIKYPMKLLKEGKVNNISFVVNGVEESNLGYGGKYGYGYGIVKPKWWQIWKN